LGRFAINRFKERRELGGITDARSQVRALGGNAYPRQHPELDPAAFDCLAELAKVSNQDVGIQGLEHGAAWT
jgi:hypothetical protein